MTYKIYLTAVMILIFASSGCGADKPSTNYKSETSKVLQNSSANKAEAGKFWKLYEEGLEYQKNSQYEMAVSSFESALKNYSLLRPEQSAAAKQLVITFELAGNFEKAIKYCEVGAEVTMNEDQRKFFQVKAQSLREQANLRGIPLET